MGRWNTRAFTLVELLVVVTIIVTLLAIVVPVMGRVIYTAELTRCGANLKAIATGVVGYAAESRMYYPYRPTVDSGALKRANVIAGGGRDDRPIVREHIAIKAMLDPLSETIDLHPESTSPGVEVYANYGLWYGWYYATAGGARMTRMGGRFNYKRGSADYEFKVLASDWDAFQTNTGEKVHAGHADDAGVMFARAEQNENNHVRSQWMSDVEWRRGVIDTNYAFDDGSVERYEAVTFYESNATDTTLPIGSQRMAKVPVFANEADTTFDWVHLPKGG